MAHNHAIDEAAKLLCMQRIRKLKIDPLRLCYESPIYFETISRYCEHTRQIRSEITAHSGSPDGLAIIREDKIPLVLYNERLSECRRAFTLAHEVGHIRLCHRNDDAKSEREANAFAANLLAPRILLWEMNCRNGGGAITASQICAAFNVSKTTAALQIRRLPATPEAFSRAERQLLEIYRPLLSQPDEPTLGF